MGTMTKYFPVIGLEIHVELKTSSKMFCSCAANHFRVKPNTHCCSVCLGLPGALPVANKKAIEYTIMAGLALGCEVAQFSKFDRKNYFYPDLAKGYQISQYDLPLCNGGNLTGIRIRRVHLEEDTAKLVHATIEGERATLIDFNRSGVPLMEIVTEPDIHDSLSAKNFLKNLQKIIRYLGISDCDMEKGSMRLEINISLGNAPLKSGEFKLPDYKVEIKNLNSFRFVEKAIEYEIERQTEIIQSGGRPDQETRGWNEAKQATFSQRTKEEAHDYRYFPEPDLPPLVWSKTAVEKIKGSIPELPEQKTARFVKDYHLSEYNAQILTETRQKADFFEAAVKIGKKEEITSKDIANKMINKKIDVSAVSVDEFVKGLSGKKTASLLSEKDLEKIVDQALTENQAAVKDYQKGKTTAIEFLLGQVMRISKGQANSLSARRLILKKLA